MNREAEAEKLKTLKLLEEKATEQPWARVLELIGNPNKDKKAKVEKEK